MLRLISRFCSPTVLGISCGLTAAVLWGGGAVVSRHLVTSRLDPMDMVLLRYAACFPIAIGLIIAFGRRVWLEIPLERLMVLLLLAGPPYQFLITMGYEQSTAGAGSLLVCGLLTVFALATPLAFNKSLGGTTTIVKPTLSAVVGAALACVGLATFASGSGGSSITAKGFAIFSTAALCWAVLNALVRRWQIDPLKLTVALAFWSPLFLPVYTTMRPWHALSGPASDLLLQYVYHGWLVAFAATLMFFVAVRYAGATIASALQALAPGVSACLGAVILGEQLGRWQVLGISITIVGVMLSSSGERFVNGVLGQFYTRRQTRAAAV
jgi:drug/metabolite transporter (DMT)-like permease